MPTTKTRRHQAPTRPEVKRQIAQMSADSRTLPTDGKDPPTRPSESRIQDARCKIPRPPDAGNREREAPSALPNRTTETQEWDGMHWRRQPFGRPTVRYRLPRVSESRGERDTDDSAPCGRAGHDVSRPAMVEEYRLELRPRNVTAGLPRGARRGEGASNLLRPRRSRGHQRARGARLRVVGSAFICGLPSLIFVHLCHLWVLGRAVLHLAC
jgi:hypothetical protein